MPRRRFTREFKISAAKLVSEQGYSVPEAAKSLGVSAVSIRGWIKQFAPGSAGTTAGDTADGSLRDELARLRKENKRLLLEREILKKATAFFAKEQS
jgi:transposase